MKIFVKFFSEINLGDDLFLKILFERYPQNTFVITARSKYRDIFKSYPNVEIIEETKSTKNSILRSSNKIYRAFIRYFLPTSYVNFIRREVKKQYAAVIQDCDVFLSIGGSIFMQRKILPAYGHIELYKFVNQNCSHSFYIGCNFGPYMTESYRMELADIFSKADDVCFRERSSWETFSELENVRYAPDVVFNLAVKKVQKIERSVGFSIISPRGNTDATSYIESYASLIQYYASRNYDVFLFSFCSKQGDDKTIEAILSHVKTTNGNIHKVLYDGNIDKFLDAYSKVEKMYCGRFHAMILSMLFEQKFYPIIYSQKMTNVLNDIGYRGNILEIEAFYKLEPTVMDMKINENKYDITNEVLNSKKQFLKLDDLLKRKTG